MGIYLTLVVNELKFGTEIYIDKLGMYAKLQLSSLNLLLKFLSKYRLQKCLIVNKGLWTVAELQSIREVAVPELKGGKCIMKGVKYSIVSIFRHC